MVKIYGCATLLPSLQQTWLRDTNTLFLEGQQVSKKKHLLGGGFVDFLFSPLPGEMIQFD